MFHFNERQQRKTVKIQGSNFPNLLSLEMHPSFTPEKLQKLIRSPWPWSFRFVAPRWPCHRRPNALTKFQLRWCCVELNQDMLVRQFPLESQFAA